MRAQNQAILSKIGIILGVVLTSWLLFACIATQVQPRSRAITYTVSGVDGATRARLTYVDAQGGIAQAEVALPWSTTFTASRRQPLSVSAQNQDTLGGVACDITADHDLVRHAEARGQDAVAACVGTVP